MLKSLELAFRGSSFQRRITPGLPYIGRTFSARMFCPSTLNSFLSLCITNFIVRETYPRTSSFSSLSPSLFRMDCRPCMDCFAGQCDRKHQSGDMERKHSRKGANCRKFLPSLAPLDQQNVLHHRQSKEWTKNKSLTADTLYFGIL